MAPIDRLVRVGTGRDAKDVAFATIFGDVQHDPQGADGGRGRHDAAARQHQAAHADGRAA
jgi:hypothetical protein